MVKIFILSIFAFALSAPAVLGQLNRPVVRPQDPPLNIGKIARSDILDNLRNIRKRYPLLSALRMAERANKLLKDKGYNFTFSVDKYRTRVVNTYSLKTTGGTSIEFEVDEPQGSPCHETVLELPVLTVDPTKIAIVQCGRMYSINRPVEFETEQVALLDRSLKKVLRKWAVPIDATPVGISRNGLNLYFAFNFPDVDYQASLQFENLIYEITSNGSIRFVPAIDRRIVKGLRVDFPDREGDYEYMRFRAGKNTFIVRYLGICT
jgi:hypothetical protein